MFSESFEKESHPYTSSVSQDIQGTHSHVDRFSQPVSSETEGDFAHTLNNSAIISPSFKSVTNAMKVGMFRLRCRFVTGLTNCATTPFDIARREEVESTLERNVNSKLLGVW